MSDLISRQAAIDAIINTPSKVGCHDNSEVARYGATFRQNEILDIIGCLPSAQSEIIRCDDCVHWWESHRMCKRNKDKNHRCACMDCDAEFYCKNAERREDG